MMEIDTRNERRNIKETIVRVKTNITQNKDVSNENISNFDNKFFCFVIETKQFRFDGTSAQARGGVE